MDEPISNVQDFVAAAAAKKRRATADAQFTEDSLALRFAELHAENMRYVAKWGKWLEWGMDCWRIEETLLVFDMLRKICRGAAAECVNPSEAKNLSKAKTVIAVEVHARSDRLLAATTAQWNQNEQFFNAGEEEESD